jgi:hypothetical protein
MAGAGFPFVPAFGLQNHIIAADQAVTNDCEAEWLKVAGCGHKPLPPSSHSPHR